MHLRQLPLILAFLALSGICTPAFTATTAQNPSPAPKVVNTKPQWSELSHEQQVALQPLAQLWPTMREPHKRKWIALSRNFGNRSPEEKSVLQGRMREWAGLTPQQRTFARLNYADVKQLSTDEKRAKWEAYQALSAADKQKLAKQQPKPIVGAAPAIKPVPAQNRVALPAATNTSKPLPRIDTVQVAPTTLLPVLSGNVSSGSTPPAEGTGPNQ